MIKDIPLVLLAGGNSTRMGTPKGLLPYFGKTWIEAQTSAFIAAGGEKIVIVLGEHADQYDKALPELKHTYTVVVNEQAHLGSFSSLQCGLSALAKLGDFNASFVLPIDVPAAEKSTWNLLAEFFLESSNDIQCVIPNGHPVLLSKNFINKLLALPLNSEQARLDVQIKKLSPSEVARIDVQDPNVRLNLNSMEDWNQFLMKNPAQ